MTTTRRAHEAVLAGVLFDFAAWLTCQTFGPPHGTIEVGSTADAEPMVETLKDFAEARGFSIDDPDRNYLGDGAAASRVGDLPGPSDEMLASPQFEAVWQVVRRWDLERAPGDGYDGANGGDVRAILDALDAIPAEAPELPPKGAE